LSFKKIKIKLSKEAKMKKMLLIVVILGSLVSGVFGWSTEEKSHYFDYVVKDKYMTKICFEPVNIDYDWMDILHEATTKYNEAFPSYNSKINFVFNYSSESICSYRVKVFKENKPNEEYFAITKGFHSFLKKPADSITINLAHVYKLDYNERIALLMHEMGHVIGLRHTGITGSNAIPTTNDDSEPNKSIMRGGGDDDIFNNRVMIPIFTDYDKKAVMYLYRKW